MLKRANRPCWVLQSAVCLLLAIGTAAAADCNKGDSVCFCKAAGGTYKDLEAPLAPACKLSYQHQGRERYVHVYFPRGYDGSDKWPIWIHLHGVFWASMGDIGRKVGRSVNATDIIPVWDLTLDKFGEQAIIVYPQSVGDPGTGQEPAEGPEAKYRQFWNIPFWRCSVGVCSDPTVDDVAFIEKVVKDLPKRIKSKPGVMYLSGESAGGMMVDLLLCQSPVITSSISAAADMLGGLGQEYVDGGACTDPNQVPYMKLQGEDDPFITFSKQILVDGVNFLSAKEAVQVQAKMHGCKVDASAPLTPNAKGAMNCVNYCAGTADAAPAVLCGIVGAGHDSDTPYPGFVFEQAWAFFQKEGRKVNATKLPVSTGAVQVNMTFADVSLATFNESYNSQVIKALTTITDVPAKNISVILRALPPPPTAAAMEAGQAGGNRRLLQPSDALGVFQPSASPQPEGGSPSAPEAPAADAASNSTSAEAAADPKAPTGVVASYTLSGDDATSVTRSLKQSAESGAMTGLLQELGVAESGPGAAAAAAAVGTQTKGLALPSMSISGLRENATAENVVLNPVALTADTPQPKPSTQLSAAITTTSSSKEPEGSSEGSSGTGMFGWGLPTWAVITMLAGGGAVLLLAFSGMCCCCCIARRKHAQEKEYEKFSQKRRARQQQQMVDAASQAPKRGECAVLIDKSAADVDVVLHTP